jgi:hypothetical protein
MAGNLDEKKMAADGHSSIEDPVTPAGGKAKQSHTGADKMLKVDPTADTVEDGVTKKTNNPEKVVEDVSFDLSGLFEGTGLSEEFMKKASVVFEAAVNEAAEAKAQAITESIERDLKEQFDSALQESLDEIIENVDGYLDYVVAEWMKENKVAVESGIKVEMAESLLQGLKELFYEHNVEIDDATVDVVGGLEEEIAELKAAANQAINERLEFESQLRAMKAEKVFSTMVEGLSTAQVERFRMLSEKIDCSNLDAYKIDLATLKESFFKTKASIVPGGDLDREGEALITESATQPVRSEYPSINALAEAMKKLK